MIALFFDTETTGIKSWKNPSFKPGIVQLGALLQDLKSGDVLAELNFIVTQPNNAPIPKEAMAVHGITDEMALKYGFHPKLADIMFAHLVGMADLLVAHNIDFDLDVVNDNMPESSKRIKKIQKFDTMEENLMKVKAPLTEKQKTYFTSKGAKPDAPYKRPSLAETHLFYFGKEHEGAHDAMADVRACRDIYVEMHKPKEQAKLV